MPDQMIYPITQVLTVNEERAFRGLKEIEGLFNASAIMDFGKSLASTTMSATEAAVSFSQFGKRIAEMAEKIKAEREETLEELAGW